MIDKNLLKIEQVKGIESGCVGGGEQVQVYLIVCNVQDEPYGEGGN